GEGSGGEGFGPPRPGMRRPGRLRGDPGPATVVELTTPWCGQVHDRAGACGGIVTFATSPSRRGDVPGVSVTSPAPGPFSVPPEHPHPFPGASQPARP